MSDAERRERAARRSDDDRDRAERRSRYDDERRSHRSRRDDDDGARHDRHDRERSERSRSERPRRDDDDTMARHSRSDRHERRERDARRSRSPSERPSERPGASYAPNFAPSGLLAKESNSLNGVALKYHEPPEARRPATNWRLFVFKDGKEVGTYGLRLPRHARAWAPVVLPARPRPHGRRYPCGAPVVLKATCCDPVPPRHETQRVWRRAALCPVRTAADLDPF